MRVALVTLGCEKNTVDSERYLAELVAAGAEVAASPDEADIVVVNTCGFVDAAKQESLDAIVRAGAAKAEGRDRPSWPSAAWCSDTATRWPRRSPRWT